MNNIIPTDYINSLKQFAAMQNKNLNDKSIFCFARVITDVKIPSVLNDNFFKTQRSFYFSKPDEEFEFLAIGVLEELNKKNIKSFSPLSEEYNFAREKIIFNKTAEELKSIPLFQCQMKFTSIKSSTQWSSFPFLSISIPEYLILIQNNLYWLICCFFNPEEINYVLAEKILNSLFNSKKKSDETNILLQSNPGMNSDKEYWNKLIEKGREKLNSGRIKKYVLSRKVEVILNGKPDLKKIIEQLKSGYPRCFIFLINSVDKVFLGASPELFMKSGNGELIFEAVAGSTPRGNHIEEEISFEKRLLMDSKLKSEHSMVKDFITGKITEQFPGIKFSENSFVRKLDNIQHLVTKISLSTVDTSLFFNLVDKLFPTPAVCGLPKDEALELINELETHERGLYSGLLGWFDLNFNGELVVAIRSALFAENKITAYAGAGILNNSISEEEFHETELKLQPILSLFRNEEKS